ncbi:sarcosine oxidase subunit delta [Rhodovulum sp. YNF3179]|uniref:sarcosine oxidase subunit delta n=1 Tax=Rhodovulum sp. YNF3179 TaxID=3425127 RepID=UPI003D34ACC9
MRITCPLCGDRDLREFTYGGAAVYMDRPGADADLDALEAYLHLRDNPAGPTEELWSHDMGCRAWLKVRRDTVTHEILGTALAAEAKRGAG